MASVFKAVMDDLRGAIGEIWPEITIIYRAPQMRKVNWVNLIEAFDKNTQSAITIIKGVQPGLEPPWCIIDMPEVEQNEDWGINNMVYTPDIYIYYITRDNSQPNGYLTLGEFLEDRMEILRQELFYRESTFMRLQILEMFGPNVSQTNEVNQSMIDSNMPYSSGCLKFSSCFGEIIG
jgi:hypothetical protein